MFKRFARRMLGARRPEKGLIEARSAAASRPPFQHQIDHFYAIPDRGFVIHGWIHDKNDAVTSLELISDDESSGNLLSNLFEMERSDVVEALSIDPLDTRPMGFVVLVHFERVARQPVEQLALRFTLRSGEDFRFSIPDRTPDPDWHAQLDTLLGEDPTEAVLLPSSGETSQQLDTLKSFVRLALDSVYTIAGTHVFTSGWIIDRDDVLTSVRLKQGRALSKDLRAAACMYRRPDLEPAFRDKIGNSPAREFGFSSVTPFATARDTEGTPTTLVVETRDGERIEIDVPSARPCIDALEMSRKLLGEVDFSSPLVAKRLPPVAHAIQLAWQHQHSDAQQSNVQAVTFGADVPNPEVSVIVTIYGRYDLIEYQMSQFALDPDFQRVELLYVIDDPSICDAALKLCSDLFPIYRVPFRVIYGGQNRGFAGANNLGAGQASSEMLLLLNSDVMPKQTGWLSALKRAYLELKSPGAIAPLLVYEDESIQHYGIHFEPHPDIPELWLNVHQYKGLPSSLLPQTKTAKEAQAVTAACLMISKAKYFELGGLDEGFVLGDFEDSDLCLSAATRGYRSYVIPWVTLYHLERQSQNQFEDLSWKHKITLVNGWRHTEKWGETIRKLQANGAAP